MPDINILTDTFLYDNCVVIEDYTFTITLKKIKVAIFKSLGAGVAGVKSLREFVSPPAILKSFCMKEVYSTRPIKAAFIMPSQR